MASEQPNTPEMSVEDAARYLGKRAAALQEWSRYLSWATRLVGEGHLITPRIIHAFSEIRRIDFLPEAKQPDAGLNEPLDIGYNQTNSQPSIAVVMLESLQPRKGQKVLDIGSGSAWTTALLGAIVSRKGRVVGTERISELANFGRGNLAKYHLPQAEIVHTATGLGLPEEGPYDRILVSARTKEEWLPELAAQLTPRGRMVLPLIEGSHSNEKDSTQTIIAVTKRGNKLATTIMRKNVVFVPLVHEQAD